MAIEEEKLSTFGITKIGIKTITIVCSSITKIATAKKLYGTSRIFVSSRLPFTFTLGLKRLLSFLMDWKASSLQGLHSSLECVVTTRVRFSNIVPMLSRSNLNSEHTVDAFSKSFINAF